MKKLSMMLGLTISILFGNLGDVYADNIYKQMSGGRCGNSCISSSDICHIGKGSACNNVYRSYP